MSGPENPLKQRNGIETRPLPQGAVLVDMNTGHCFRLNRVGAEIWTILESPLAVGEVSDQIATRYEKPVAKSIQRSARWSIELLIREQLIEIAAETPRPDCRDCAIS